MNHSNYKTIQKYIDNAQIQRSVYLADLIASSIFAVREYFRLNIVGFFKSNKQRSIFSIE